MFICLCFSSPNMKQSQEKKSKLFTLFCAMWHQSIQPSENKQTNKLYHCTREKQEAPPDDVYILSINVNILSLVWNDVYILFQTLDIVYALE